MLAARDGDPTLADPTPTLAPHVVNKITADFNDALNPDAAKAASPLPNGAAPATDGSAPATAVDGRYSCASSRAAPVSGCSCGRRRRLRPDLGRDQLSRATRTSTPAASGNSMGVEILTPGATTGATAKPADDNGGLKAVGPVNATPLPAAEKPAEAPERSQRHRIQTAARRTDSKRQRQEESEAGVRQERRILQQAQEEEGPLQTEPVLDRSNHSEAKRGCSHWPHPFFIAR